ncbi:MAG: cation:proton antiporter, partial [Erysipelotrichaceae bacterium]
LFVLVGASVNIDYALASGFKVIILIFSVLMFRMLGVYICLIKTKLNNSEKVFTMVAYTPKATVQAAIGSIPLAMGLACGNIVLSVAVMSILITAPLGSFLIDLLYKKCLTSNKL